MVTDEPIRGERRVTGEKPLATLDLVAQTLRHSRDSGGACLIVGAGVSVSAGIPAGAGLVERLRELFPESYRLARDAAGVGLGDAAALDFHFAVSRLALGERARLIADVTDGARLNWEHLVIAELMAEGLVGPVLTTNFDALLLAACARANVQPAVYDLGGGAVVPAAAIAGGPAVIHLHGQHDRLVPLATAEQRAAYRRRIEPLLGHLLYRGVPIVAVGFGGAADEVVDVLAGHDRFTNRLYWATHFDHPPAPAARALLDGPGNDALVVPGYDAETFLIGLGRKLGVFPPRFVADPYGETVRAWKSIRPPSDAEAAAPFEAAFARLMRDAEAAEAEAPSLRIEVGSSRASRSAAPPRAETGRGPRAEPAGRREPPAEPTHVIPRAAAHMPPFGKTGPGTRRAPPRAEPDATEPPPRLRLVVGDYQRLVDDYEAGRIDDEENGDAVAWAYVMLANAHAQEAQASRGARADALWSRAMEGYQTALRVNARHADALYNWASALAAQAQEREGTEAVALWGEAAAKYEATLKIRPRDCEALSDCARALAAQARGLPAAEAAEAVDAALERLENAYRLGDDTAYVGYLEVALAHARDREIARFLEAPPPRLPDASRYALALVYLVFVLEHGQPADLVPFDELPRLDAAPCADWDFDEIGPAITRLGAREAGFVRAAIDLLQGSRPLADWPSVRDAWLAGRSVFEAPRPGVTSLR